MSNDTSPNATPLKCEAIEGPAGEPCGEGAEQVEIRDKIASVRAILCPFHQGVMSEEEGYLVVRETGEPTGEASTAG